MSDRIAGWSVSSGPSPQNASVIAEKVGVAGRQHVVKAISISFNGTPSTPVYCALTDPDVSPNATYWEGYVGQSRDPTFPSGIAIPPGAGVALQVGAGGGSLVGIGVVHGITL